MRRKLNKRKKFAIALVILMVVILVIIFILANIPTHRFNNYHIDDDEEYGVSNKDIDILWIKSSDRGDYVLLEMNVAGKIRNTCYYAISVVGKNINNEHDEGFIFRCGYSNGRINGYDFFCRIINENTLQIQFPKDNFDEGIYMIGIEGYTNDLSSEMSEVDFCRESMERDNNIPRLLPI